MPSAGMPCLVVPVPHEGLGVVLCVAHLDGENRSRSP